jgi:recombination protein RecA
VGVDMGVIEKRGTWFSFQSNRLGQGREAAKEELKNNVKMAEEIEKNIYAKLDSGAAALKKAAQTEALASN